MVFHPNFPSTQNLQSKVFFHFASSDQSSGRSAIIRWNFFTLPIHHCFNRFNSSSFLSKFSLNNQAILFTSTFSHDASLYVSICKSLPFTLTTSVFCVFSFSAIIFSWSIHNSETVWNFCNSNDVGPIIATSIRLSLKSSTLISSLSSQSLNAACIVSLEVFSVNSCLWLSKKLLKCSSISWSNLLKSKPSLILLRSTADCNLSLLSTFFT